MRVGKIGGGKVNKGRDIYFATYQALAEDETRKPALPRIRADFFDLIIVDECSPRQRARRRAWREILEYFTAPCNSA